MGNLWRNREFRRSLGWMVLLGAGILPFVFWFSLPAGLLSLALIFGLLAAFCLFTRRRYRQIARLSDQLAAVAAGGCAIDGEQYVEGELDILASELSKITSSLLHQARNLQRDKSFLADSLADISHQLKTPLTSISMLADLLDAPELPEEKRREFLEGIRTSLNRIQWLITSLLKLSRLDAGAVVFQPESVDMAGVLETALAPLQISMELKNQRLEWEVDGDAAYKGDKYWLAEALGNLLKNCVEHTPEGGVIAVRCGQNALYTEIVIQDNGPGIPERDLPHIFERFYRGKNAAPDSVGIGLALSKSIVQNLGGTLAVENRPSGGSRFTVKLYGKTVV